LAPFSHNPNSGKFRVKTKPQLEEPQRKLKKLKTITFQQIGSDPVQKQSNKCRLTKSTNRRKPN
jgi:hypothetical protein